MNIKNIINSLLNQTKKIELSKLPSLGLFYKDDFEIWIKKADVENIIEYEYGYKKDDVGSVIMRVKNIVKKNVILSKKYEFNDIKSVDVVYIFFEIVKLTNRKSIKIEYLNDMTGEDESITFESKHFNYAEIDNNLMKFYNSDSKEFIIDGFRYSPPCIGVENSLTRYLISKTNKIDNERYIEYNYDFLYFLGHRNKISPSEIENLIQIYNHDISKEDSTKVSNIILSFDTLGLYSLKKDSQVIEITSKIDLEKIWK